MNLVALLTLQNPSAVSANVKATLTFQTGLVFTRPDQGDHGRYETSAHGTERLLVPPVPFRMTVEVEGYEPWHYGGADWQGKAGLIGLKSGESLSLTVRVKRQAK